MIFSLSSAFVEINVPFSCKASGGETEALFNSIRIGVHLLAQSLKLSNSHIPSPSFSQLLYKPFRSVMMMVAMMMMTMEVSLIDTPWIPRE